jgi:hypothetical protein
MAAPRDSQKEQSKRKVRGPIPKQADIAHEIAHHAALMLRDKITHSVVEMEGRCDRYRCNDDPHQPVKNGGALHK